MTAHECNYHKESGEEEVTLLACWYTPIATAHHFREEVANTFRWLLPSSHISLECRNCLTVAGLWRSLYETCILFSSRISTLHITPSHHITAHPPTRSCASTTRTKLSFLSNLSQVAAVNPLRTCRSAIRNFSFV
jgi:hypothetical protein